MELVVGKLVEVVVEQVVVGKKSCVAVVGQNNVHRRGRCGKLVPVVGSKSLEHKRRLAPLGIGDERNEERFLENYSSTWTRLRHVDKQLENSTPQRFRLTSRRLGLKSIPSRLHRRNPFDLRQTA